MENNKKTGIIILNYNNSSDTINCIKSVEKYNTAAIKYIVVDNGSSKTNTIEELDSFLRHNFKENYEFIKDEQQPDSLPYMTLLQSSTNDGYAQGNNKGLQLVYKDSEIDKILILNSDILFIEDILPGLIKDLETLPQAGIVSPLLYKKNFKDIDYNCCRKAASLQEIFITYMFLYIDLFGIISRQRRKRNLLYKKRLPLKNPVINIELPSGSCMLLYKDLFRQLGSFDSHTFLYYEEDILYRKIKINGLKNYLDTSLRCIHLGATTTKKTPSQFIVRCGYESMMYYLKTYTNVSRLYLLAVKFFYFFLNLKIRVKSLIVNVLKK